MHTLWQKIQSYEFLDRRNQRIIFCLSICLYLFYYISIYYTHTLNNFFVWDYLGGMDFFQIPNGAYAFLHGGTLQGVLPHNTLPYTKGFCCSVNWNVYHPVFTLLVGIPLILFTPGEAVAVWAVVHILVMGILIVFLWSKFRKHKYIYIALSILLVFSYNYYDIWLNQYHFLFTFFTVLFVYESMQYGDTKKAGLWLFLSLLIKPVGVLWFIPLLLYKRYTTVSIGYGLFLAATIPFVYYPFHFGKYYINNVLVVAGGTKITHNIYSIMSIFPAIPAVVIKGIGICYALSLLILQLVKKPNILILVTLWIGYQLLFYGMVYHYHYSVLAGLIALGILFDVFSIYNFSIIPVGMLTLPTPLIFMGWYAYGLSRRTYAYIWLYTAFWLCCLLGYLLWYSLRKPYPVKQSSFLFGFSHEHKRENR